MASIWSQMDYVPPRGPCNYKSSLVGPKCACLRFMIHPLKISSSFSCDGCAHHASYHDLENKHDDEVITRWKQQQAQKENQQRQQQQQLVTVRSASDETIQGHGATRAICSSADADRNGRAYLESVSDTTANSSQSTSTAGILNPVEWGFRIGTEIGEEFERHLKSGIISKAFGQQTLAGSDVPSTPSSRPAPVDLVGVVDLDDSDEPTDELDSESTAGQARTRKRRRGYAITRSENRRKKT